MKVEIYKPTNSKLKKHIDCFYILTHSANEKKTSYLTFPSIFTIISAMSDVEIFQQPNKRIIRESSFQSFESTFDAKFSKPLFVQFEGNIKEITIYFKPLGINAFLENYPDKYCGNDHVKFIPFDDYQKNIQAILKIKNNQKLINSLEEYWLGKLKDFTHSSLNNSINEIIENPELSITKISENNGLNHKYMIKLFKKHLCKTPSEFRKTVRFRKALNNRGNLSLTELSYLSSYFDQAHMIKDFKTMTGFTPKEFFRNLSSVDKKINWIFLD